MSLTAMCFIVTSHHAIAATKIRAKVIGACDSYFSNLSTGPVQGVSIPDGTKCRVQVTITRNKLPLSGKGVDLQVFRRASNVSVEASGRTNRSGKVVLTFTYTDSNDRDQSVDLESPCSYSVIGANKSQTITLFNATVGECSIDPVNLLHGSPSVMPPICTGVSAAEMVEVILAWHEPL